MFKKSLMVSALILGATSVQAQDFDFQGRVMAGVMDYEFTIDPKDQSFFGDRIDLSNESANSNVPPNGKDRRNSISESFPILGFGGTVSNGKFFADFYYQSSLSADASAVSEVARDDPDTLSDISDIDVDRTDAAITFGWGFTDNLSAYIGYKTGETELSQSAVINSASTGNSELNKIDREFKQSGPFIGLAYGHPIGNGVLGLNAAVAKLDADYDVSLVNQVRPTRIDESLEGDTTGLTIGINWKAPLTNKLIYAISFDAYKYTFDGFKGDSTTIDGLVDSTTEVDVSNSEIEEEVFSLRLAIIYRF